MEYCEAGVVMCGLDEANTRKEPLQESINSNIGSARRNTRSAEEVAANYVALTDNAPTGIIIIQHGRVVYANPYILRLMGYTANELPELNIWQLIHPEDRERVKSHYTARMRGDPAPEQYEFRVITKTGEIRHVELRATLIQYDGEPAVLDNIVDITDRKRAEQGLRESEERYRRLVDLSPDAIVVVSEEFIVFANEAALTVYGASTLDDLVGKRISDFVASSNKDLFATRIRSILDGTSSSPLATEELFIRLDGTTFHAEVAAAAIEYNGRPAVLAMIRDVTERKRVEEHRREFTRQLELHKRQFYRDTILSVTNGKLDICEPREINAYVCRARMRVDVREPAEVPRARHETQKYCEQAGLVGERLESFMIAVGEAITNAVKHAHGGRVYAGKSSENVWVGVADKGSEISSLILPRATLQRGYSTKPSLGMGYTIMLSVADRIILKTGNRGTTVVLVQNLRQTAHQITSSEWLAEWGLPCGT
ncbi:MAG: PAS domain S-box protein [Armatimonadota bacterium]